MNKSDLKFERFKKFPKHFYNSSFSQSDQYFQKRKGSKRETQFSLCYSEPLAIERHYV